MELWEVSHRRDLRVVSSEVNGFPVHQDQATTFFDVMNIPRWPAQGCRGQTPGDDVFLRAFQHEPLALISPSALVRSVETNRSDRGSNTPPLSDEKAHPR